MAKKPVSFANHDMNMGQPQMKKVMKKKKMPTKDEKEKKGC